MAARVHLLLLEHRLEHALLGRKVELCELEPVAAHPVAQELGVGDVPLQLERRAVGDLEGEPHPVAPAERPVGDHADAAGL